MGAHPVRSPPGRPCGAQAAPCPCGGSASAVTRRSWQMPSPRPWRKSFSRASYSRSSCRCECLRHETAAGGDFLYQGLPRGWDRGVPLACTSFFPAARCCDALRTHLAASHPVPGRSELAVLSATAMLTGTVRQIRAPPLLHRLVLFLLGPDRHPETPEDTPHPLRTQLIDRCNHLSDEVSPILGGWGGVWAIPRGAVPGVSPPPGRAADQPGQPAALRGAPAETPRARGTQPGAEEPGGEGLPAPRTPRAR